MRAGPALLGAWSWNFPYKRLKAFPSRRAWSQSSVHTTKFVLAIVFWDNFSFFQIVFVYVSYKMKTCTQISDSVFRGKI